MAHRLLVPPARRMSDVIRLPEIQDTQGRLTTQFLSSLMVTDALRRVKTSPTRICTSPLANLQRFVEVASGGSNTPHAMAAGAHKMNSRRLVAKTRGQSAGIE